MDESHTDPLSEGLRVMVLGYSLRFTDDRENLARQLDLFDSLYAWCRLEEAVRANEGDDATCLT
jgi:hypothetical protein